MLSVIRRALGQTAQRACRRLSTVTTVEPLTDSSLAVDVEESSTQVLKNALQTTELASPSAVNPFVPPVYLTMSSLLRPTEDAPPTSQNVVELDPTVFGHPIRRDILHLCVVHYLDSLRQGTASTKTRGEVRGSGAKIRPQKGSGRARLGDGQSPMLRGGGVAFGPKPRDFATKLNRKVIQMGMRVALSARVKENSLGIVESLEWPSGKTKDLAKRIDELGWRKTLFVSGLDTVPEGLIRASNNIHKVEAATAKDVNVYDVVKWDRVILDLAAVEWFERALSKTVAAPPRVYDV
ncbi:ribosomal protein L4 domain-containing protein [Fomitopsis serialis]|uniref:ribosomal protein L4 domain-containing protein n=1 Tax=Fomitopsis serialis TaxID=139415 RepID=UPI00200803A7|nr:ribosomal protein L4 domain-containing protein [Neoantrodia serialis]KAH9937018.1 ribosomal protein L4 domain-containing protein [Neoantrodia serialis]